MACGSPPATPSPSPESPSGGRLTLGSGRIALGWLAGPRRTSPRCRPTHRGSRTPSRTGPSCRAAAIENAIRQDGPWNAAGRACFWTAYQGGQPAEFTSTRLTMEGDPITTIYRVLGDERVELFIDSTQDRYGSGAWEHAACTSLAAITDGLVEPDFGPDESCEFTPLE